jgi:hypothetical protein
VVFACPWYIRTTHYTGNPFYPFAYNIFGGLHWSADRAEGYERHQMEFGVGELPSPAVMRSLPKWKQMLVGPREPWKWMAAPFMLTFRPADFEVKIGNLPNTVLTAVGPLYLALLPLLLLWTGKPPATRLILWLFLPLWLWWFASMQLARYLLPNLALLAPLAGYAAWRASEQGVVLATAVRWALGLWVAFVVFVNLIMTVPALPVVLGAMPAQDYLLQTLDVYTPSLHIAKNLPPDARVATYGEVRGFYFDRDCFWAEYGHSDLIPYHSMKGPADLIRRYHELGITHVLVNQSYLPGLWASQEDTLRLLRESIEQGYLQPIATFQRHPNFLLYEVAAGGKRP